MSKRLDGLQRKLLDEGHALVVNCAKCDDEHFLGTLPMPMDDMVRITRRFKCPNDKSHKLLMGPLSALPPADRPTPSDNSTLRNP